MRVLVTGARGMLAQALIPELRGRGHEVLALGREDLDVTDEAAVSERVASERPEVVVQCAAYTAVDAAEGDEAGALRLNAEATRYLAEACQKVGARLVYPSSDYVFRGDGTSPYQPNDATDPLNAYGRTKRAGEQAALGSGSALVVRTSWLYGAGGPNFVDTMLRLAPERDRLQVVDDQIGRPTWTVSLAETISALLESGAQGIFHATNGGSATSWFGFAQHLFSLRSMDVHLVPVPTSGFPRPAARPRFSVLDCSATEALLGEPLPDWRDSLARYLNVR